MAGPSCLAAAAHVNDLVASPAPTIPRSSVTPPTAPVTKHNNYTYIGHIIHEVHVMAADDIWKRVSKPHHVDIIVHDGIPQLKNLEQVTWTP
jgi:hypothetical protein